MAKKAKKAVAAKQTKRSLQARRAARTWPRMKDDVTGRFMSLYCAEYKYGGATWGLDFWAYDAKDAAAKLKAMRTTLSMLGVIQGASK